MIPSTSLGVDADQVAAVATRLRSVLPPPPPLAAPWSWEGTARDYAASALAHALAAHERAVAVLSGAADALGQAAVSLTRAADLDRAATQVLVTGGDPGVVDRLRADAAAETAVTDRALAARLEALGGPAAHLDLSPLALGADPETGWVGRPLSLVPPGIAAEVAALEPSFVAGDPLAPVALRLLTAPLVVDPALLHADPDDPHPVTGPPPGFLLAGPGRVAEVWGDVTTARDVVVLVPGTGTSIDDFGVTRDHGQALADAMGPDAAVVVWLGSALPANLLEAALQRWAKEAAPRLTAFVRGLDLRPDARLTLIGHSYGAVVAGLAVHEGLRPTTLVGVAPAGFGPTVGSTDDLGGTPTYVLEDARDPIRDVHVAQSAIDDALDAGLGPFGGTAVDRLAGALGLGHLGDDPVHLPGAVELVSPHDTSPLLPVGFDGAVHSEYFEPGSEGLAQLIAVARGELPVIRGTR